MKAAVVVGTRPEIIKTLSVVKELDRTDSVDTLLIHTGQHYDYSMSRLFFDELTLREPDYFLEAQPREGAAQVSSIMEAVASVLMEAEPDVVLVEGDTASAMAAALSASQMQIPVGHIEAGCRSYDRGMVEETNRRVIDAVSDILFAPTETAYYNLIREGHNPSRVFLVGSTVADALQEAVAHPSDKSLEDDFVLATIHRPSNTDDKVSLSEILHGLAALNIKCVFPIHPRTRKMVDLFGLESLLETPQIEVIEPLGYVEFVNLLRNSKGVITDSGGVQEEAFLLGKPTITLRSSTEWPETIWAGKNRLTDVRRDLIEEAVTAAVADESGLPLKTLGSPNEVGRAIVRVVLDLAERQHLRPPGFDMIRSGYPFLRLCSKDLMQPLIRFDQNSMITIGDDFVSAICEDYWTLEKVDRQTFHERDRKRLMQEPK